MTAATQRGRRYSSFARTHIVSTAPRAPPQRLEAPSAASPAGVDVSPVRCCSTTASMYAATAGAQAGPRRRVEQPAHYIRCYGCGATPVGDRTRPPVRNVLPAGPECALAGAAFCGPPDARICGAAASQKQTQQPGGRRQLRAPRGRLDSPPALAATTDTSGQLPRCAADEGRPSFRFQNGPRCFGQARQQTKTDVVSGTRRLAISG